MVSKAVFYRVQFIRWLLSRPNQNEMTKKEQNTTKGRPQNGGQVTQRFISAVYNLSLIYWEWARWCRGVVFTGFWVCGSGSKALLACWVLMIGGPSNCKLINLTGGLFIGPRRGGGGALLCLWLGLRFWQSGLSLPFCAFESLFSSVSEVLFWFEACIFVDSLGQLVLANLLWAMCGLGLALFGVCLFVDRAGQLVWSSWFLTDCGFGLVYEWRQSSYQLTLWNRFLCCHNVCANNLSLTTSKL